MFRTVLDEWVCKDVSRVRRFGYLSYLLDSVIEWLIALLRACNNCEMLKPPTWCPSISSIAGATVPERGDRFRIVRGDLKGVASSRHFLRPAGGIYISDERPLLHSRHRSFRRSPVTRKWNETEHRFAGLRCYVWMDRAPIYKRLGQAFRISMKPRDLTGIFIGLEVRDDENPGVLQYKGRYSSASHPSLLKRKGQLARCLALR